MTSGNRCLPAILLLPLWLATLPATAAELEPLLAQLVRPAPATTAFVEVRWPKLLTEPLVSAGTLEYRAAGVLGRQVERPYREHTEIDGDRVRVAREGRTPRRFSLARAPELRAMLGSFGALIGGDVAALRRDFELALESDGERWRLQLVPREARLRKRLARIDVDGHGGAPRCFWIAGADGTGGAMLVEAAAREPLPQPPTRAALERHCRGEPPA